MPIRPLLCVWILLLIAAPSIGAELLEGPMVPPAPLVAQARMVNPEWMELSLPELPYAPGAVGDGTHYSVTSTDDSGYASAVHPILVQHRHWPENAWYADTPQAASTINVIYRIYLHLPAALGEGRHYTVQIDETVLPGGLTLTCCNDGSVPNESIHVNQVAYRSDGPKIAYLSLWTGEGTVDFSRSGTFTLVDEASGSLVHSGAIHLETTADHEPWSRSNVYAMDFTTVTRPGRYHVHVPGMGNSFSFAIEATAFNRIAYTLIRGLTMMRDGAHGLDSPQVTHWTRPSAHLDDAIDEMTGTRVDLVGGHMDAGDRGKYPYHTADVAAAMLSAIRLFPKQVEQLDESLQIPESHNGIPDVLDEAAYELDFLAKVVNNSALRGAVTFFVRPNTGGYEQGQPPAGATDRMYFDVKMGPLRPETLYAAGALAMAATTPSFKRYMPQRCAVYLAAAQKAYGAYRAHAADDGYWKTESYDVNVEGAKHPWSDELVLAATALLEATGEQCYLDDLNAELPADFTKVRRWSWQTEGPWLNAFVEISTASGSRIPSELKRRAHDAIIDWAAATMGHDGQPFAKPFGMPLPDMVYSRVGWFFSGSQTAFPLMIAYGATGDPMYRVMLIKTWNYLLGGNPLSRSFITGLGDPQHRPRWLVQEISQVEWANHVADPATGWCEPMPGLPAADIQNGDYEWFLKGDRNTPRMDMKFPEPGSYPALYRYHDSWTTTDEYTIDRQARGAMSVLALVDVPAGSAGGAGHGR